MLEPLDTYPACNYSNIVHTLEGTNSVVPQLNYTINIVLKLKSKLAKIKIEIKEIKKQLSAINLSFVNEIRHSRKYTLSISTPF